MPINLELDSISKILDYYPISEFVPVRILRESSDNSIFLIGERNKKILRVSKKLPIDDIKFEYEALQYLAGNNFPIPAWVKTRDGKLYASTTDIAVAMMFEFLEGFHFNIINDVFKLNEQIRTAGRALASLDEIGKAFKSSAMRHRNIFSELERVISNEDIFRNDFNGGEVFVNQVRQAITFGQANQSAIGLIHNDYRPSNVLFKNNLEISAVIDFDWSCIGPQIKDLALAVLEWSYLDSKVEPDFVAFDLFLEGYNAISKEKYIKGRELYSWIMFSALSDASTYFCDRLNQSNLVKDIYSSFMYKKYLYFSQL